MSTQALSNIARRRRRVEAVMAGMVAAEAVWLVARLFGLHLQAPTSSSYPQSMSIGPGFVAAVSGSLPLLGWGVLALLERFTSRAPATWLALALFFLAVSFLGPLSGGGVTVANRAVLMLMHVSVAAIVISVFYRTSLRRAQSSKQSRRDRGDVAAEVG